MCRAGESGGESLSTQFMESILRPLLLLKQTKILLCEGGESSIDMLHSEELRKAFEQCLIQCKGRVTYSVEKILYIHKQRPAIRINVVIYSKSLYSL